MSFRIRAQRKSYTKAVMLLIQQALVAFWTAAGSGFVCFALEVTKAGADSRSSCGFQEGERITLRLAEQSWSQRMAGASALVGQFASSPEEGAFGPVLIGWSLKTSLESARNGAISEAGMVNSE